MLFNRHEKGFSLVFIPWDDLREQLLGKIAQFESVCAFNIVLWWPCKKIFGRGTDSKVHV